MKITFHGAVREVTGSLHLLETSTDKILFDCGMFQGRRRESEEKNRTLPFDPAGITTVILSHAHIDHSGRLPLLTSRGFGGRIVATRATTDASEYLLLDSAHIQESDAAYLNYKSLRNHLAQLKEGKKGDREAIKKILKKDRHRLDTESIDRLMAKYRIERVEPLYTKEDAAHALTFFDGYPYRHPVTVGENAACTFYEAGHILGSAISVVKVAENGRDLRIGYTGDIGRFNKPILRDPAFRFDPIDREIDLLIMESTYGDRLHEPAEDSTAILKQTLIDAQARGGAILIPSFAFGRTQELVYVLHELYDANAVPKLPIYVDSPLATKLTRVFGEHPEVYDQDTHETFLQQGKNPFSFGQIRFTESVEESMTLMQKKEPHIVIASSGMCEAGRILHHLRYKIHNPKNTILIVGYMAQNTLGRRILEQGIAYAEAERKGDAPILKFLNKTYPLKAEVVKLGGFSAHGDRDEMLRFLMKSDLSVKRIAVVHGDEDQSVAFAGHLKNAGYDAFVPDPGMSVEVD